MTITIPDKFPKLRTPPPSVPTEGVVSIEIVAGMPVFRASERVQNRIGDLLQKQRASGLNQAEEEELDMYEEVDDYLSFVNRIVRNRFEQTQ